MVEYTPALDKLISAYGDFFEAQLKDMLNPKTGALSTSLRLIFRTKTQAEPLRDKIWALTGWDVAAEPEKHLPTLIEMAEQNGSKSAEKLKSGLPVYIRLMQVMEANLPKNTGILKGIRYAKKLNLTF